MTVSTEPPPVDDYSAVGVDPELARWTERALDRRLSPALLRCFAVLWEIERPYNLPFLGGNNEAWEHAFDRVDEWDGEDGPPVLPGLTVRADRPMVTARLFTELATFDGSALTRVVVAAHRLGCRVAVRPGLTTVVDYDSAIANCKYNPDTGKYEWVDTGEHPRYPQPFLNVQINYRSGGDGLRVHPGVNELVR